jgi:hypothetical protein
MSGNCRNLASRCRIDRAMPPCASAGREGPRRSYTASELRSALPRIFPPHYSYAGWRADVRMAAKPRAVLQPGRPDSKCASLDFARAGLAMSAARNIPVVGALNATAAAVLRLAILLGVAVVWLTNSCAAAERRVALVVGAASYAHAPALAHTLDDARDVAAALKRLGFDVDLVLDPNRGDLERAVRRLGERSRGADASLFYYSGHAIESQGVNWVLPVSANIENDRVLRFEALDLDAVREQVEGLARVSLVFLDACREDPFKQRFGATRGLPRSGLAPANNTAVGSYVVFATAPGKVAADGTGPHSPFTGALLKYIETPGLEIRSMMSKVIDDVEEATDNRQIPWDHSSLKGDFFFNAANSEKVAETVNRAINGPNPQVDLDALFWESVDKKKVADLNAYLVKFPQGAFVELARNRLAELKATPVPAAPPPNPKLLDALSIAQANLSQKSREDFAAKYQALQEHKAMAAYLAGTAVTVSVRQSAQEAEEGGLEACEVLSGAPCVLVMVDDEVRFTKDAQPRPMPRALYTGAFNPERIPSVRAAVRQRPDILGYLSAPSFKAAAYYPFGNFFVVTGAPSQHDAELQVLALCNDDPQSGGRGGPCYLYASNNDVVLPRRSKTPITAANAVAQQAAPPNAKLLDALSRILPSATPKFREDNAASYQSAPRHKALAVNPRTGSTGWVTRPSEQEAEDSELERCEVAAGSPCLLIAVNDDIKFTAGSQALPRAMPRVHYVGPFDPERIPSVQQIVRQRSDVVGYRSAAPFRAAAYHPSGKLFIVGGAASQRSAEEQVLANCNDDTSRNNNEGPCFLYASGDAVVLARRSQTAIADAPVAAPVAAVPGVATFHDAFMAQITRALPAFAAAERESTAKAFEEGATHKAFTVHGRDSGYLRLFGWQTAEEVEEATLEACQSYYGDPCALVAVDDTMKVGADGALVPRDMPRVRYQGVFDTRQIPAVSKVVRGRADLQAYSTAGGAKAAAFHPWGQPYVAYSSVSQNEAETKVLAACNGEPARKGQGGPCYLYASGNQVVFTKRLRLPMTPAVASTPAVPPPASKPVSTDDGALIDQITDRLAAKLSAGAQPVSMAEAAQNKTAGMSGRNSAQIYVTNATPGHKAIAVGLRSTDNINAATSTINVAYGAPSPESAQALALERCQIAVIDPCSLVAFDRIVAPADGSWKVFDRARVRYDGIFDPNQIPGLAEADRNQTEVKSYYGAPMPKAAVIGSTGKLFVVTGAGSQSDAETQAFAKCGNSTCYLYAVGNQVVLQRGGVPQRMIRARSLGNSFQDVLSYALVSKPDKLNSDFGAAKSHKAIVLFPELRATWYSYNFRSGEEAERAALEICGLRFNTTCVTVEVDDRLVTKDPLSGPRRTMPRLAYQGPYRPDMVPTFETPPSIAHDYLKMRSPKAMAIRPSGPKLTAESGATLAEAEAKALAKCTDPDSPYPCFLYAENDNVVLPLRRTEPRQ